MTANDIMNRAQANWGAALTAQIAVDSATIRWGWVGDALLALFGAKGIARVSPTTGEAVEWADITAGADSIDIDDKWRLSLSNYVTAMGFYSDAENQAHQERAAKHMELFTTFLNI